MARNAAFDVVAFFFHDHCVGVLFQMKGDWKVAQVVETLILKEGSSAAT